MHTCPDAKTYPRKAPKFHAKEEGTIKIWGTVVSNEFKRSGGIVPTARVKRNETQLPWLQYVPHGPERSTNGCTWPREDARLSPRWRFPEGIIVPS